MLAYRRNARHNAPPTFDVGNARDALISFECVSGVVKVVETVGRDRIQSRVEPSERDVVSELEEKYIFFADEAEIARKLIRRGHSCVLSVYFREA